MVGLSMEAASPMAAAAALLQSPHARSLPVRHTAALERLCELNQAGLWFAELGALADLLLAASGHPLRLELQALLCQLIRRASPLPGRAMASVALHNLQVFACCSWCILLSKDSLT